MNIWKKKASDLTVEEITLLSLGLGVGVGAITYVYKETDWLETVGRKISELCAIFANNSYICGEKTLKSTENL